MRVWAAVFTALTGLGVLAAGAGQERQPAVLFHGGVHSGYVVRPLVEMGVAVNVCPRGKLAEELATGRYNVAVVGILDDAEREALDKFLGDGGGVFASNPDAYPRLDDWDKTNRWLEKHGARPRWEVLKDADEANVVRDVMGCRLSWSTDVSSPFREGVEGVLTLMWNGTTGCEPPMSFDLGPDWQVVVRGAKSMYGVRSQRHDLELQPWIPAEDGPRSPPLLAIREVGQGRLAVMGIRGHWLFVPPPNCPTAEAMLTAGAGGKPSQWLRVFANTFRWLADPSFKAGKGGAETPESLRNPPVQVWETVPVKDWTGEPALDGISDQLQTPGLIGARTALSSGSGTVAEYVREARKAGLRFIVFLEDSMKMDQAAWKKLVAQCAQQSDKEFAAIPGLTYEDAQGNHLYALSDNVQFPGEDMLLPDRRLATVKTMRSRAYFDYVNELMGQKMIGGFWRHKENFLHFADYKLYNSFPIYSAEDGVPVDSALDEYMYLVGIGGCQAALAFEIMNTPDQVAERATEGWRVVAHRPPDVLREQWFQGAWSFSGSGSQYVTQGPSILVWQNPNRLTNPHGEWWRPDLWEMRLRLRVGSERGLRSVAVHDGDRRVLRRWLPGGAKRFEQDLVMANDQQTAFTLVVEDMSGRKAVSMAFWSRNCIMEEFFCSDRCNFLGNARLRTRDGRQVWTQVSFKGNMGNTPSKGLLDMSVQPAVTLTMDSPTLPIDGRPMGFPTVALTFRPDIPGELTSMFAYPTTYLVGAEIAVGQGNYILGYDPAERGALKSPLGHDYVQPQQGQGNAWGSWHRLIPTRKVDGWTRTYACNWLPEQFRIGWHETQLELKDDVTVDPQKGIQVMYHSMNGWILHKGEEIIATPESSDCRGAFEPGVFATFEHGGGSAVLVPLDNTLTYLYRRGGSITLHFMPQAETFAKGETIHYKVGFAGAAGGTTTERMVEFARMFGVAAPGETGYAPILTRGRQLDTCMVWRLDAEGTGVEVELPQADMPGFLPVSVERLRDTWSVHLLDRAKPWPNHRALPVRDGRAFAQLDPAGGDSRPFIGHPVTADNSGVTILVAWKAPGVWFIEAHNPGDEVARAHLVSSPGWTVFRFDEQVELAPGSSRTWEVRE